MQLDIQVISESLDLMKKEWPKQTSVTPRRGDLIKSRGGYLAKIKDVIHCGVGTRPILELDIVKIDT